MLPLLFTLLGSALAPTALACGGGEYASLDEPLLPASSHVEGWLYREAYWGEAPEAVTRFLYAVRPANPRLYAALDEAAETYGGGAPYAEDEVPARAAAMQRALAAGDAAAALAAAAAVVEAVWDLPAPLAEPHGEALRLAVEYIELAPSLRGAPPKAVAAWFASTAAPTSGLPPALAAVAAVRSTSPAEAAASPAPARHPRAASLRWLALRHALVTQVPDGWTPEDIRSAAPGGFGPLRAAITAWLRDFPDHPLADYVRLKQVRLDYLAGEVDPAWRGLLDQYLRHPARAANEMRFLIRQGLPPKAIDLASAPPEIAAGLLTEVGVSPVTWNTLWRRAESEPAASWSLPLQERLLLVAMRATAAEGHPPLPAAFPAEPAARSPLWARLRLAALLEADRLDEAALQAPLTEDDPLTAPMRAQIALAKGDWLGAIHTRDLDPDSVRYLIRVLAPPEVLDGLVDDADEGIRWEARLAMASRQLADGGRWKDGARWLDPVDPERAALWRQADKLSRSDAPPKKLAYARFLAAHGGQVFVGRDHDEVVWYRSLPLLGPPQPDRWTPKRAGLLITPQAEWDATAAWLERSFVTWYAIEAYADWMERVEGTPGAEGPTGQLALREADAAYNALLNYGSGDFYAWGVLLPDSEPARQIRQFGRWLNQAP